MTKRDMDNSFVYKIAGHFIEIVWNLPEGQKWHLPGFMPFLYKNPDNTTDKKLVTIHIVPLDDNQQLPEPQESQESPDPTESPRRKYFGRKIAAFDIENGKCELHKKDNKYKFLVFFVEGDLSIRLEMNRNQSVMTCSCALYKQQFKAAADKAAAAPKEAAANKAAAAPKETAADKAAAANKTASFFEAPDPHHLRFALWMGLAFAGIPEWTTAIHASVIIHENQAVLFLGESGTGKSTHTRLWLENIPGTRLLNDDSPVLRLQKCEDQHTLYIYGSPWSGKGHVYRNESYPVASIVRLQQAPFNRASRLNVVQGFAALYPSFPPAYLKDEDLHEDICTVISETLKAIPVYRLECLPKPSAAEQIFRKIFGGDEEKSIA